MTIRHDDHGAISTFLAVVFVALLMAAGLVVDGGRKVAALREASHLADNAARAGAQAVDIDMLRSTGDLAVNPTQAVALAEEYLATAGHTGRVSVDADTVIVTVTLAVNATLLPVDGFEVTATETATAVTENP